MLDASLQEIARRLNGRVSGRQVVFPSPGHSKRDRGSVLKLDPAAPDGFIVKSFNADWRIVRQYVLDKLGIAWRDASFFPDLIDKKAQRRQRNAEYMRQKRRAEGARPHSASIAAQARLLGLARSTIYRRRARME